MHWRLLGLIAAVVLGGGCASEAPQPQPATGAPQVFTGTIVPLPAPPGTTDGGGVALSADNKPITYTLLKDEASAMLFEDSRFHNRAVRLTALPVPGTNDLRVVLVQTVKDGKVYDVDYWCGVCQISSNHPGKCVCCGDDVEFREQPAK